MGSFLADLDISFYKGGELEVRMRSWEVAVYLASMENSDKSGRFGVNNQADAIIADSNAVIRAFSF